MRVTNSRDGVKRVNMQVTHRLAGNDFASVLCLKHLEHDLENDGPLPDLAKDKILEMVREALKVKPDARYWWRDDVEEDVADQLWEWADKLIREKFPEMY